ncbi:SMI1/KNR4 family protein [Pedobacter sp. GSP4]|uniref:SMI1/KNR4 family protein n=1 Tax=Pedobacter sp. GSP4 TaxID=3453716 RepID=UPI003EECED7A
MIKDLITAIAKNHKDSGFLLHDPASNQAILEFEKAIGFELPPDFREFYSICNGFECDEDIFNFLSLEEIIANNNFGSSWFYFAEYMIYSDMWSIRKNDKGVIEIYNEEDIVLTSSLSEFLERFLNGGVFESNGLYHWNKEIKNKSIKHINVNPEPIIKKQSFMKNKPLLQEILWLLGCIAVSVIIGFCIFGKAIFEKDIDINLHDTYFVIANHHFLISFFLIISFTAYFIKEKRRSFKPRGPFLIFLFLGLCFVVLLTKASPIFSFFNSPLGSVWTVYPPLSAVATTPKAESFTSTVFTLNNTLVVFQVLIITLMLFASYKHGKQTVCNKEVK